MAKKTETKKQKAVPQKKYLVRISENFGFGKVPAGNYVMLCDAAAKHYKSKNII